MSAFTKELVANYFKWQELSFNYYILIRIASTLVLVTPTQAELNIIIQFCNAVLV